MAYLVSEWLILRIGDGLILRGKIVADHSIDYAFAGEMESMKLDVYGRRIEVVKERGEWAIYTLGEGKKNKITDFVIPADLGEEEILIYVADIFHELATPEKSDVRIIK
jgi:hypothetical protein